jgi:hypothetical protein
MLQQQLADANRRNDALLARLDAMMARIEALTENAE